MVSLLHTVTHDMIMRRINKRGRGCDNLQKGKLRHLHQNFLKMYLNSSQASDRHNNGTCIVPAEGHVHVHACRKTYTHAHTHTYICTTDSNNNAKDNVNFIKKRTNLPLEYFC